MILPFYCIGIAFLLIYLPKVPMSLAQAKQPGGYDNKMPRVQQAQLSGWGARAQAAHMNAFEAFPPFAAAVIVAALAGADREWMNILALTHIGARAIYPFIYMANLGTLRSLVWTVGFGATAGLFILPIVSHS